MYLHFQVLEEKAHITAHAIDIFFPQAYIEQVRIQLLISIHNIVLPLGLPFL